MSLLFKQGLWPILICLILSFPAMAEEMDDIVPGHWLELRGKMDEQGVFVVQRVDLIEPENEEVLIGTIPTSAESGEFTLLGQLIQISPKTTFSKVAETMLANERVKVEGHYRGRKRFSARKISARGPGRDRLTGLVSDIRQLADGYSVTIMNQQVHIPAGTELRYERPIAEYSVASLNIALPQGKQVSEDDQFGEGFSISKRLRFSTLVEARYKGEDNYDLDDRRDLDRQDTAASIRGRFVLSPGKYGISGQLEARFTRLRVNEDRFDTLDINDSRLGESFIFFDDPFDIDFDIQAGRMDFDDRREWVYDQNLDGLRVYWTVAGWLAELSATTTLSDGKLRDENTDNYVAYVSDRKRRFAAYVIHRDTDLPGLKEKITHTGLRAFVEWPPQHDSWLEIAHIGGKRNSTSLNGWGMDIGTTRSIGERWYLTAAWAFGQGDDNTGNGTDGNFRQTRLQDNNGKFGGVTSFRYYGELIDPELANMHIGTLGLGYRFTQNSSIDLVGHYYAQHKAIRKIIDSDIDQKPNGIDRELGWEVDAIIGWRPVRSWDFELVLGWFKPGKAFRRNDDAWVSKLQIRYRY